MEILGVGPAEMLVIMVIALIVFGPGRLPEIGAALGRMVGDLKRASRELTADLQGSVAEARGELAGTINSAQADLQDAARTVEREAKTVSKEVTSLPSAAKASTTSGPASSVAKKVDKENPADDDPDSRWLQLGSAVEE